MSPLPLAVLASSLLVLLVAWRALSRFVVQDTSMQPALQPTDRLLVCRWLPPRRGDLLVVRDPERPAIFLVKRVANVGANGDLVLQADNPNVSRDSRHFGPVPRRLIVGRAILRYLPAERRGWLASRQ